MAVGDDVIVRHTPGTTTYHFGRIEAICGEVPDDEATTMTLDAAGQTGMENPVAKRVALRILDNGDPKTPGQSVTRPRQDSNLRTRFRRPVLYPLSYGGEYLGSVEAVPLLASSP